MNYHHYKLTEAMPIYRKEIKSVRTKELKSTPIETKEEVVQEVVEEVSLADQYFALTGSKADGRWSDDRLLKEIENAKL